MNKNNSNPNSDSLFKSENLSAKLAIIAGVVSTFGDFLGTVSAAIALEEIRIADNDSQQQMKEQEERMQNMQKQIDQLTLQINQLSKK